VENVTREDPILPIVTACDLWTSSGSRQPAATRSLRKPVGSRGIRAAEPHDPQRPRVPGHPHPDDDIAAHPVPLTPATPQGAGDFARAYYAELDRALQTNDVSVFDTYLKPSCPFRQKIDKETADRARYGYLRTGGSREISKMLAFPRGSTQLELKVESTRQTATTVDANRRTISIDPGHTATEQLSLDYSGDRWIVTDLVGNYSALG
jgi:N-acetylmuramoyl-L-alanine amidase